MKESFWERPARPKNKKGKGANGAGGFGWKVAVCKREREDKTPRMEDISLMGKSTSPQEKEMRKKM